VGGRQGTGGQERGETVGESGGRGIAPF